jgi:hypothetical protein
MGGNAPPCGAAPPRLSHSSPLSAWQYLSGRPGGVQGLRAPVSINDSQVGDPHITFPVLEVIIKDMGRA